MNRNKVIYLNKGAAFDLQRDQGQTKALELECRVTKQGIYLVLALSGTLRYSRLKHMPIKQKVGILKGATRKRNTVGYATTNECYNE
jgi:hypothetical protein